MLVSPRVEITRQDKEHPYTVVIISTPRVPRSVAYVIILRTIYAAPNFAFGHYHSFLLGT